MDIQLQAIEKLQEIKKLCQDTISYVNDKDIISPPSKECGEWAKKILRIIDRR